MSTLCTAVPYNYVILIKQIYTLVFKYIEGSTYTDGLVFQDEVTSTLFKRIVHRFCNKMTTETVRKFKRLNELKSSDLQQGLQAKAEKKMKKPDGIVSVTNIITDPLPKPAKHFSLKAMLCKGDNVFECYSHMDLNFIMLGYDVPPSNENKKKSKTLVDIIKACGEEMPRPDKLTQEVYNAITAPTVGSNIPNLVSGVQNAENSDISKHLKQRYKARDIFKDFSTTRIR